MIAMILAAGKGERLKPITNKIPKPLIKINGKSLIEYHLENLNNAGFKKVLINVSYLGNLIYEKIGCSYKNLLIFYSFEPDPPLDTAGGISFAQPWTNIQEPFLILNADIWFDWPLKKAFKFFNLIRNKDLLAHLILIENNEFKKNDFYLDNGLVKKNTCYSNHSKKMLTYSGCGIYSPKLFLKIERGKKFPLVKLLNNASDRNLISGERFTGEWFDVGTRARLKKLKKLKEIKN